MKNNFMGLFLMVLFFSVGAFSQTTEFTYQGDLQNGGVAASGNFDFEFLLFNAETGGTQAGSTLPRSGVTVTNGIFSVKLDFGANFPGADRFLEIHVKLAGGGAFTPLTPRHAVTSAPYSVKSLNATTAGNVTGVVSIANGGTGSSTQNFVDLTTNQNVVGDKTFSNTLSGNVVNTATQFNIGGLRVLARNGGASNIFAGVNAGVATTTGSQNAFFGESSGQANTTGYSNAFFGMNAGANHTGGASNSFFGYGSGLVTSTGNANTILGVLAGQNNTVGNDNTFVGAGAGDGNDSGSSNTMLGTYANVGADNLNFATALGAGAIVSASNTMVLGRSADTVKIPGSFITDGSAGIGTAPDPSNKLHVRNSNDYGSFGQSYGIWSESLGVARDKFGVFGQAAGGESSYGVFGYGVNATTNYGVYGTGVGIGSTANYGVWGNAGYGTVNYGVFGSASGNGTTNYGVYGSANSGTTNWAGYFSGNVGVTGNVGVGTDAPAFKLHIVDTGNTGLRVQTNVGGGTVASFGGGGAFQIDAPGVFGGRLNVSENGNVGIGTNNPQTKLQVQGGSVYIANPNSLIITSPNGACWFITVGNTGVLSTISVTCP